MNEAEVSRKAYRFDTETKMWNKIPFADIEKGQWIQLRESNGCFIGIFRTVSDVYIGESNLPQFDYDIWGDELYEPEV